MGDALRERDPEAVRLTVAHALLLREGLPEPVKEGREESEGDTLGDALTELHSDSLGLAVLLGYMCFDMFFAVMTTTLDTLHLCFCHDLTEPYL